jgi:hypothetical protein
MDLKVPGPLLTGTTVSAGVPEKFFAQQQVDETSQKFQTETTLATIYPSGIPFGLLSAELTQINPESICEFSLKTRYVSQFSVLTSPSDDPEAHGATTTTIEAIIPTASVVKVSGISAGSVATTTAHGLDVGDPFAFTLLTGDTAGNIHAGFVYYVVTVTNSTHLTFSATLGGAAITDSATSGAIIGFSDTVTGGLNIIRSAVQDLDGTHSLQSVTVLTDPSGWPSLVSQDIDPVSKIVIEVQKQVVDASLVQSSSNPSGTIIAGANTNGAISQVVLSNGGGGYLTTPDVDITDDTVHTGAAIATATAVMSAGTVGQLSGIALDDGGSGFVVAPSVGIAPPEPPVPVTGINSGLVTTLSPHGLGVGDQFQFSALVSPTGGVTTSPTTYFALTVTSLTLTYATSSSGSPLSGHNADSGVLTPTFTHDTATATAVLAPSTQGILGTVIAVPVTQQPTLPFTSVPTVAFRSVTGDPGTGATLTAALITGGVALDQTDFGAGYTAAATGDIPVTDSGPGSGAVVRGEYVPSDGGLTFDVTALGSGYSNSTQVNVVAGTDGNGSGASVTLYPPSTVGGQLIIQSATPGTGFTSDAVVTIVDQPTGYGTATAILDGSGTVTGLNYGNNSDLFSLPPGFRIAPPMAGGTNAAIKGVSAILRPKGIQSIRVTGGFNLARMLIDNLTLPVTETLSITGGLGDGAVAILYVDIRGNPSVSITKPGSGYSESALPEVISSIFYKTTFSITLTPVTIDTTRTEALLTGGSGYASAPYVQVARASVDSIQTPLKDVITAVVSGASVGQIVMSTSNSGWPAGVTATVMNPPGFNGVTMSNPTVTLGTGLESPPVPTDAIKSFAFTGGSGYTSPPAIVLHQGGGSGGTITGIVGTGQLQLAIKTPGSGYVYPQITIPKPLGSSPTIATATITVAPTGLQLTLGNPGSGYKLPPYVDITPTGGDTGTAIAESIIATTSVERINLVTPGDNYDALNPPAITFGGLSVTGIVAGVVTTATAHGLIAGDQFQFSALTLPTGGVATGQIYYVLTALTDLTLTYAATLGGAELAGHGAALGTLVSSPTLAAAHAVPVTLSVIGFTLTGGTGYVNPIVTIDAPTGPNGIQATAAAYVISGFLEIKELDKWRSIQILSRVNPDSLPLPENWNLTVRQAFPAVLKSQYFVLHLKADGYIDPSSINHLVDLQSSFSASVLATGTRSYYAGPPTTIDQTTPFCPTSHDMLMYFMDSGGGMNKYGAGIPSCLHGVLAPEFVGVNYNNDTVTSPSADLIFPPNPIGGLAQVASYMPSFVHVSQGRAMLFFSQSLESSLLLFPFALLPNGSIPATNPSSLVPGSTYIHAINVEKWRLGIWVKEVITGIIPALPTG